MIKTLLKKPRYVKYIFSWGKSPLDSGVPWVNFDTKEWLDRNLNKDMIVFEYGCGGSTLYYAKNVKKIISVEHDKSWYENVKNKLNIKNLNNFEIYLCQPEEDVKSENNLFSSSDEHYVGFSFKKYAEKINDYPNDFFDLVVIDGRARNSCIKNTISKVKNNGYIFLDNSERKEYGRGIGLLNDFEVEVFFSPGFYGISPWEGRVWKIKK